MSIRVQNLTKEYNSQRAVNQISLTVQPGEIVGFLGPNGAGKSTTMKIATGYLPPTDGTVEVNGFDVRTNPMDVRRSVGYLPEHNPLYLDLYVKEYLRFAGSLHGLHGANLTRRISDMIDLVGLGREQHKKIGQLSKGYRQRVGLAQALLHNPPVLILDEPTTGLDPNQLAEIRQVIREAGRDKTVLFSTHIMQEVEAVCDRVVIINRGQIVADGSLNQLRSASAGEGVIVVVAEFEDELASSDVLTTVTGVQRVEPLGQGQYRITAVANTDLRASIFRLAADQNLTLVGLRQQENSLEGIFKELTK
ncbi:MULTISPECIES: gliding motility-associated ABC transporter ATP-binding subunit GldA [Spirosoma]|uniref:Gliding motility-associated ABC transporter ATP-binding subunit GldA n=1 Tax=Spirosoma liriopis TaxID=2937440 RepID=A0ABT0HK90_9BACT|nr:MULTISPECIES: gliding motility-associated ABC transporter ATP-binding subunit GldA [Spirosoma]MCK8492585.1 gliding motility-associated ABC transporter ATP-binding subunit GldA [Spirosoma liriopis]UHG92054.1 gliding motility-associated ABC transporter ATP-binding subunit GldA [Spirosoma oryzicola]